MTCPRCAGADPTQMPAIVARQMLAGLSAPASKIPVQSSASGPGPGIGVWSRPPADAPLNRCRRQSPSCPSLRWEAIRCSAPDRPQAAICRPQGLGLWAKLQISATHEIATVPNIPLPNVLYDKLACYRKHEISGIMSIWTMGTRTTLNSYAAVQLMRHAGPLPARVQWHLARTYFENRLSDGQIEQLLRGWDGFFAALQHHPVNMPFLYHSPINYAPAYPWPLKRKLSPWPGAGPTNPGATS